MRYLIDTDHVVDWLRNRSATRALIRSLLGEGIGISLMTYGEIYTGIFRGQGTAAKEDAFDEFLREARVLPINGSVMRRFGRIQARLLGLGQGIGVADVLIAATALDHDLTLVTRNLDHFRRIPDLRLYEPT